MTEETIEQWVERMMKDPELSKPIPMGEPSIFERFLLASVQPVYTYYRTVNLLELAEEHKYKMYLSKNCKEADIFIQGRVMGKDETE